MLIHRAHRGFTIIELMVSVTIIAVLVMVSIPSISGYFQTAKLSSAASSYESGLQLARAEAIRMNLPVQFVLTDTPVVAGIETAAALNPNGRNWVVRYLPAGSLTMTLVEAKAVAEGAATSGTPSIQVTGTPIAPAVAFDGSITFDGLGASNTGGPIQLDITNPAGGACATVATPTAPMRCPRIRISSGGQVRRCDPAAGAGDSRACP